MNYHKAVAADSDLRRMYLDGSARFGMRQAKRYFSEIERALQIIGDNPRLGRERPEWHPPVRIHLHGSHVIVYRIEDDGKPMILRIRHRLEDWVKDPI